MENTTMTKGIVPMSMSRTRTRIERSQSVHLLSPVAGDAQGTTLSFAGRTQAIRTQAIEAVQGGNARGLVADYAPSAKTSVITTTTTPFMDVDYLRSGRPPA
jgi:hypothetical protein